MWKREHGCKLLKYELSGGVGKRRGPSGSELEGQSRQQREDREPRGKLAGYLIHIGSTYKNDRINHVGTCHDRICDALRGMMMRGHLLHAYHRIEVRC